MTSMILIVLAAIDRLVDRAAADDDGAAAVEYGLLVALIAAAIVSTVALLGPKIVSAFQTVVDSLTGAGI